MKKQLCTINKRINAFILTEGIKLGAFFISVYLKYFFKRKFNQKQDKGQKSLGLVFKKRIG